MQVLVKTIALLCGALLGGGALGALHPLGDSLAVFRVPLAVVAVLAVIWTDWPRRLRWPLAAVGMLVLLPHARAVLPQPGGAAGGLTLYQQNLRFDRADSADWLAEVARRSPDVLTLQEVSTHNLPLLETLRAQYPAQVHCPFRGFVGEAVLSRLPMVPGTARCSQRDGLAIMQVEAPGGPVWLVSVHLNWPWPHGQAPQVDQLLPALQALSGPVIIAGDFNAVGWSHTLARIAKASGTRRIGPHLATFDLPVLPLPVGIDHVLASGAGRITVLPKLGSDHHGLWAELAPLP